MTVLATYYVTYVITRSELPPVQRARDWVFDRGPATVGYLVTCGFCTAFYVAALAVLLTDLVTSVPLPVLLALAAAAGAGFITELVDALRASTVRSLK